MIDPERLHGDALDYLLDRTDVLSEALHAGAITAREAWREYGLAQLYAMAETMGHELLREERRLLALLLADDRRIGP